MYIPYDKIFATIALLLPFGFKNPIRNIGTYLKTKQNLRYIKKNKKNVLNKLKNKIKNKEKIITAFYIYDRTKWKSQSIYDLMEESEIFEPWIFVTKNCAPKTSMNYQEKEEIPPDYEFFKNKNMRVKIAYDFEKDDYIPFEDMNPKPDMIFYSHPWFVYKTQGPVMASKYALTYYIPYSVPNHTEEQEYFLRFHQYVGTYYVMNDTIKKFYSENMANKGVNLKTAGHSMLDYFYLNKNKEYEKKNYVIYAPHWSITKNNQLLWATFLELGNFMLEYAKNHPEIKWIYKPHPCLKSILKQGFWTNKQIDDYWKGWAEAGIVVETGDYLDMFMESDAMITDCGSFEVEYFMTKKPVIHLKSKDAKPFNEDVTKIVNSYYEAANEEELKNLLDEVILNKNDYKQKDRLKVYKELGYENMYCAKNVMDDLKNTLGYKDND